MRKHAKARPSREEVSASEPDGRSDRGRKDVVFILEIGRAHV